jgi:hypothetical protein
MALGLDPTQLHQRHFDQPVVCTQNNRNQQIEPMKTTKSFLGILTITAALAVNGNSQIYTNPAVGNLTWQIATTAGSPVVVGWEFSVESPINIVSLGIFTNIAIGGVGPTSASVSLWNGAGIQVASCYVSAGDPVLDGFEYHPIASLQLQPGQNYTIACLLPHSEEWFSAVSSATFAQGVDFVARRSAFASNLSTMPTGDSITVPPGVSSVGGFGPSFEITPVPEPSFSILSVLASCVFILSTICKTARRA